jgi:hypothetical protein
VPPTLSEGFQSLQSFAKYETLLKMFHFGVKKIVLGSNVRNKINHCFVKFIVSCCVKASEIQTMGSTQPCHISSEASGNIFEKT